ncbi:MAG: hydrogenase maturation protease [Syntrophomonadaceae bacterium]|nr:hydrogenase maturation protease [Syntrophomonadaceae bacterium]
MTKLAVVGIGNLLMQDEGVGVHVINHLAQLKCLPEEVDLIDAGVNSYDMLDIFADYPVLILIDAMQAGGEPGTIYRVPLEELGLQPDLNITSLHELHFIEAVSMAKLMGYQPEILVFGLEPETIKVGMELSPTIQAKLPQVMELVTRDVERILAR